MSVVIHHGTPLSPRAALRAMAGRAFCVSFWRPDDAEVVEAISPSIMFRQRRLLGMAGGLEARRALVRARGLDAILRLAGTAAVPSWAMGSDTRRPRRALPAQRRTSERLALWPVEGGAALAHGRPDRPLLALGGTIRPRVSWLDRRVGPGNRQGPQGSASRGLRALVPSHGRVGPSNWQPLAGYTHDARRLSRPGVSIRQRGFLLSSAERPPL